MPKALGYRILLEVPQKPVQTAGGIYLPDEHIRKVNHGMDIGIVKHIGESAYTDPRFGGKPWVKQGDIVYCIQYAGLAIKTKDNKLYRFVNDEDVYGIVDYDDLEDYMKEYIAKNCNKEEAFNV